MNLWAKISLSAWALVATAGMLNAGQQTNNHVLQAIPAPAAVAIDGDLAEWDRSGEIVICYDLTALLDSNSVRVNAMYDKDCLYLSFHFRDHTPLLNYVDPLNDLGNGWKSDGIELRLQTDQIVNVQAWYYTARQQPTVFIGYGQAGKSWLSTIPEALKEGAQEAFQVDADGKGYTQELALPWKLLYKNGGSPAAGAQFKLGIQANWGDGAGNRWPSHRYSDLVNPANPQRVFFERSPEYWGVVTLAATGSLPPSASVEQLSKIAEWQRMQYSTKGVLPIAYRLPKSGYVTLAIESEKGERVRNLFGGYPREAGDNVDYWDGCDDEGRLQPAGNYRVRGLYRDEVKLRYEFAYGNPGSPAWLTPDTTGGWLSNHTPAMSVAADKERIYASSPFAEGATAILCIDRSGRRLWGISNINGGMLASDGTYLYALIGGPTIAWGGAPKNEVALIRIHAATGKYAPFPDGKQMHSIASIPPESQWQKPHQPEGELYASKGYAPEYCQRQSMGLAISGGKVYASLYYQNQIVVIDAASGTTASTISLPHPAGLAAGPDGAVYAVSQKSVVRLEANGSVTPVITGNLSAPVGLAVSAAGEFLVSDWGEHMGVRVFSAQGKFVRQVGTEGGRPLNGAYRTDGMVLPWGVAVDPTGSLWVAEFCETPRRISVWNPGIGALVKEFCGTTPYAAGNTLINPFTPTQAIMLNNTCELDWQKGLWRVTGSMAQPDRPGAWFSLNANCWGSTLSVVKCKGQQYLLTGNTSMLTILRLDQNGAVPLAAIGQMTGIWKEGSALPDLVMNSLADPKRLAQLKVKYPRVFSGDRPKDKGGPESVRNEIFAMLRQEVGLRQYFQWADRNGDGAVQPEEIRFLSKDEAGGTMVPENWKPTATDDLTLYLSARAIKGKTEVWRLPVREWNANGSPVYDYKDVQHVVSVPERKPIGDCGRIWSAPDGNLLLLNAPMVMLSQAGKTLWEYPNPWPGVHGSHTAPQSKEGRVIGPLYVMGSAELPEQRGTVFCLNGNLGERYLMTTDGLFVANLLRDCRSAPESLPQKLARGEDVDRMSAGGEPFGGSFFRNPQDGNYYLEGPVDTCREASMVLRVGGIDSLRRLPDQLVQLDEQKVVKAQEMLQAVQAKESARKWLNIKRLAGAASAMPAMDQFSWSESAAASLQFDAAHAAKATWTYDDKKLFLAFRAVTDDTPLINGGDDYRLLFKTGDALTFELRKDVALSTPAVSAGDVRLLISVMDGKPLAVLYDYRVPGTAKPMAFASPVGTNLIDQVRILPNAEIVVEREANAYNVRVAVPLADLGFQPVEGKVYRGDFGVIYSDRAGKLNELRMYWSNPVSGMVKDVFAESQIAPGNWGSFELLK